LALKLTTSLYYTPSGRSIHRAVRDTLGHAEEDEEPLDAPAAAPDTTPAPRFRTAGGRMVYGGGGITPDLVVVADSLPTLTLAVERRGLPFRFANRWANAHPGERPGSALPAAMWEEFTRFLTAEKLEFDAKSLAAERKPLERSVRRELARRTDGDAAAARVALEGDPVFARALEILGRVRAPGEVFAAAGLEAPKAGAAAR
jgi:carboxyl-terminal processing protease